MNETKNVVVIGNGMVGHRFIEKLIKFDTDQQYKITTFCEESRAAYDRVGLTSFFAHRNAEKLMIARLDWYKEHGVDLHIGDRASKIDTKKQLVTSEGGVSIAYDFIVMATGSYPFVPPVPGIQKTGVFVYRTIEDLQQIIAFGKKSKRCAVIGGGLLGLEAAKAAFDLGLETHVVEFSPRLMPRQLDDAGSALLAKKLEAMGVHVHLNKATKEVMGDSRVSSITFADGETLAVDMIIVSAGIRPRDDLARETGITVGDRGGVQVDDHLRCSVPNVFAVGEVALHRGMVYGLVSPGYEMAEVVAANLCGDSKIFSGADLSTKLKLMGVDVASFGDHETMADDVQSLVLSDPFVGTYKKLFFNASGDRLLGGILVGDAADYGTLSMLAKSADKLACKPAQLIGVGSAGAASLGDAGAIPDGAQVCSCNDVKKEDICRAIADGATTLGELKACTQAGTGCGGCMPLLTDIFQAEMKKTGAVMNLHMCEHFDYSRQEMFDLIRFGNMKDFDSLINAHGTGNGCEICKPAAASIFASLWNQPIVEPEQHTLQDTNDRFLANVQRGGSYSVVPRIPGGEITPDKLIVIGNVAKKYGLYTKITGGQRIDMFGAQRHELPSIWEELIDAGFESGHAYGKSLRTVKSCVGSSWCRYGVQDSVGFAIRLEERYRGIRAPHKIKFAVSGCVRECAEAQCKDVGLIATDHGYNLYVGGNGGAKPRHADLLATDIDEQTCIQYIDRMLMYYIFTADKLNRTATWLQKLEGGVDYLKQVIIDDKLGLCGELEERMQHLVDTYRCEWAEVVNDPAKRKLFQQFVNTDETESDIEFVDQRGQSRPADWPKQVIPLSAITRSPPKESVSSEDHVSVSAISDSVVSTSQSDVDTTVDTRWVRVGVTDDFPIDGGATIRYGKTQIAVFNFTARGEWYASQNMCPHKNAFVLSRGIVGNVGEEPKVVCPLHKKPFSLKSGECMSGEEYSLQVFPVKIESGAVFLALPPQGQLDALLATELHSIGNCSAEDAAACAACV